MKITCELGGHNWQSDLSKGHLIGIEMDFDGNQPNHFGAEKAERKALQLGGFIGDTARGGGCNVDVISIIPHCNGTHTETISHIVNERVHVGKVLPSSLIPARLVTTTPVAAGDTKETYRPELESKDQVISANSLEAAFREAEKQQPKIDWRGGALVLRTSPNDDSKRKRHYDEKHQPPFLTVEAMEMLVQSGIHHLLVDLPSVDRMYDDGKLTNHHLFWNVPENSHKMTQESLTEKTITEMVYVPDELKDGVYLLSLQAPAFLTDAAPSRPILYRINQIK